MCACEYSSLIEEINGQTCSHYSGTIWHHLSMWKRGLTETNTHNVHTRFRTKYSVKTQ